MPYLEIRVTASAGDITAGRYVPAASYTSGFDHAALVAARRSRADGYDFRLWHSTGNVRAITAISGANTSNCRVEFIAVTTILNGGFDDYRLYFGNLGQSASPLVAAGSVAVGASTMPGAMPAVTLPAPGFTLDREDDPDVDGIGYPDVVSPRWSLRNQNQRNVLTINWANISAEDWYEIRAFVNAYRGGAGTWNPPSWMPSGIAASTDMLRLVSWNLTQETRDRFVASVTVEGGRLMPTDIYEPALAALATAFRTIGDAGVTTWAQSIRPQVSRNRPDPGALAVTPSIWIWRHVENFITDSIDEVGGSTGANIYAIEATVDVSLYFEAPTWSHDTDTSKWRHDMIKAVRDHTLGSTIHDIRIVSVITGLPDPEDPSCKITMQLRLRYQQNEDDPSVAIA